MKPVKWLIEGEMFPGEVQPFEDALDSLGVEYVTCEWGTSHEDYLKKFSPDDNVVVHSSVQLARLAKKERPNWIVFCDERKYECRYYYPRFFQHLVNSSYFMIPFGDLERSRPRLKHALLTDNRETGLFIKSDAFKAITGKVFRTETWEADMRSVRFSLDPQDLIVVSAPVEIGQEWRMIVVENKIVAGTRYKPVKDNILPQEVIDYAQSVLDNVVFKGEPAWVLDVCETPHGYEVMEIGPFSCCGFYASNPESIIQAINAYVQKVRP